MFTDSTFWANDLSEHSRASIASNGPGGRLASSTKQLTEILHLGLQLLWLKDPRRTGMIQVIIKQNLFIIYIIWVDGGYQGLVNSEGKKKKSNRLKGRWGCERR